MLTITPRRPILNVSRARAGGSFFAYKELLFCGTVRVPSTSAWRTQDNSFLVSKMYKAISGIYVITCEPTGKCYVGSSINIKARWQTHRSALARAAHNNPHLQFAWNKYGESAFTFSILEEVPPGELIKCEMRWIAALSPAFNAAIPNEEREGWTCAPETRQRLSDALTGRVLSEEHIRNMSKARVGIANPWSDAARRHQSERMKGVSRPHKGSSMSKETVAKISAAQKGRPGRVWTDEERKKVSDTLKGRSRGPMSEEQRRKISESKMGRVPWNKGRKGVQVAWNKGRKSKP